MSSHKDVYNSGYNFFFRKVGLVTSYYWIFSTNCNLIRRRMYFNPKLNNSFFLMLESRYQNINAYPFEKKKTEERHKKTRSNAIPR